MLLTTTATTAAAAAMILLNEIANWPNDDESSNRDVHVINSSVFCQRASENREVVHNKTEKEAEEKDKR